VRRKNTVEKKKMYIYEFKIPNCAYLSGDALSIVSCTLGSPSSSFGRKSCVDIVSLDKYKSILENQIKISKLKIL
jgi:hypothetical protein